MKRLKFGQVGFALLLAAVIFLGAFLLFGVQPLIGRYLLPWFGGTPEVWTTCMLFFQVFLLAGYAYAHYLVRIKSPMRQVWIHLALLGGAIVFLPIFPQDSFKPQPGENPILKILLICAATVGLPYLVLSATSPLVQKWFSRGLPGRNPYRLYALSNAGSLLALAGYPFIFEPLMTRGQTVYAWSGAFAVFAGLCTVAVLWASKVGASSQEYPLPGMPDSPLTGGELDPARIGGARPAGELNRTALLLWLGLPAAASVELLAVTNKITQDIAVIPFLWVLPLSLYLLSFIISFEHQRWYRRWLWVPLFMAGIIGVIYARVYEESITDVRILIGLYVGMLFACCMVCHGEVYRLRPEVKHLTAFYLAISAGGALGGFFVAVIAPLIFTVYIEQWLGILAVAMFLLIAESRSRAEAEAGTSAAINRRQKYLLAGLIAVGAIGIVFMGRRSIDNQRAIENRRNFFGVLTVWEEAWDDPQEHKLLLQHGTTFHGLQFQSPEKKDLPTAYYSPDSGGGLVLQHFRTESSAGENPKPEIRSSKQTQNSTEEMAKTKGRKIGVVGLGVGTLAVYGQPNDVIRFYEINADVEDLAREYFTYLSDSKADVEVLLGDARLTMENQAPQNYDILVLDAFSSDAVPVHLLTKEAMEVYLKHLSEGGVLAFHISTMHLDLQSVVWRMADEFNLGTAWIEGFENEDTGALASDWILLSYNTEFLSIPVIQRAASHPSPRERRDVMLWTDDHINLLEILKDTP